VNIKGKKKKGGGKKRQFQTNHREPNAALGDEQPRSGTSWGWGALRPGVGANPGLDPASDAPRAQAEAKGPLLASSQKQWGGTSTTPSSPPQPQGRRPAGREALPVPEVRGSKTQGHTMP